MPAYAIAMIRVKDPDRFEEYSRLAVPVVQEYGGRLLARGNVASVPEGKAPCERVVVIEFPTVEAARACYSSPAYLHAQARRTGAADFTMLIVQGD